MSKTRQARELRDAVRHLVVAHGTLNAVKRPCGTPLSVPHAYALLELLQSQTGLTTTALATRLSIDRTNVSRLVARMENAGEVKRSADTRDRRARAVRLTPLGKRLAESVDESSAAHFAALSRNLGVPVRVVIESLRSLGAAMTSTELQLESLEDS